MNTKKASLYSLNFLLCMLMLSLPAMSGAETVNCTAITALPYTITTQGVYCLTGHLNTSITDGSAITINANNVVLDLNGFKIGGLSAGLGTQTFGIYANLRQNITIKNGTVRGFLYGIWLDDIPPYTTSQGHVIEDIRADQNTFIGIWIQGNGNIIRNNQVVATGGSTVDYVNGFAFGMYITGKGARLLNNDVTEVTAQGTSGAYGVYLFTTSNSVLAGNRVANVTSPNGSPYGIYLDLSTDLLVRDNSLSGTQYGIYFDGATGTYMNNLVRSISSPYTSGTAAGATNY